jgi:hypothetical protein
MTDLLGLLFCFETRSCYVAQTGLKIAILLPQPPECWDHKGMHHTWLQTNPLKEQIYRQIEEKPKPAISGSSSQIFFKSGKSLKNHQ